MKVKLTNTMRQLQHMLDCLTEKKGRIIAQGGAPTTRVMADEHALRGALWVMQQQYDHLLRLRANTGEVVPMSGRVIESHIEEVAAGMSGAEILEMMGE